MDRITKALVEDFMTSQVLKTEGQSIDFEKFVNYTIISKEYTKSFEIDTVTVGAGNDTGIDGIGIIVNRHLQ